MGWVVGTGRTGPARRGTGSREGWKWGGVGSQERGEVGGSGSSGGEGLVRVGVTSRGEVGVGGAGEVSQVGRGPGEVG